MSESEGCTQTTAGLLDLMVWSSETLLAAELTGEGVVRRANSALLARSPGLAGQPFHAIVCPPHRAVLDAALHGAAGGWTSLLLGLFPDGEDVPADHRVWISGSPERILLVAEPAHQEDRRVIDALRALNEELLQARRAERSRRRAERDCAHARRLLAGWRELCDPAPDSLAPCEAIARVLDAVETAVEPAAVLVLRGPAGRVVAARGPVAHRSGAGRAGSGRTAGARLVDDPLAIRLLSPRLAAAGLRRVAVVPAPRAATLHVGWREPRPRDEDELALLGFAARRMADAAAVAQELAV